MSRMTILPTVHNDREETADGLLEDSLLQLGGQVGLHIQDRSKTDMPLNLRGTGWTDIVKVHLWDIAPYSSACRGPAAASSAPAVIVLIVKASGRAHSSTTAPFATTPSSARSITESLEMQSQNGRDGRELRCLGGLTKLTALFTLVSRVEMFTTYKPFKGLGHIRKW